MIAEHPYLIMMPLLSRGGNLHFRRTAGHHPCSCLTRQTQQRPM